MRACGKRRKIISYLIRKVNRRERRRRGGKGGLQRASASINFSGTDTTLLHVPFLFRIKNAIARASKKHGQENAHERNERFEVHGDRAKEEEEEEDIFAVKHDQKLWFPSSPYKFSRIRVNLENLDYGPGRF